MNDIRVAVDRFANNFQTDNFRPRVTASFVFDRIFDAGKWVADGIVKNMSSLCFPRTSSERKFGLEVYKIHEKATDIICSICFEDVSLEPSVLMHPNESSPQRQHIFHQSCISKWFERDLSCPTCRKEMQPQEEARWLKDVMRSVRSENLDRLNEQLSLWDFSTLSRRLILFEATRSNNPDMLMIILMLMPVSERERKEAFDIANQENKCFQIKELLETDYLADLIDMFGPIDE